MTEEGYYAEKLYLAQIAHDRELELYTESISMRQIEHQALLDMIEALKGEGDATGTN